MPVLDKVRNIGIAYRNTASTDAATATDATTPKKASQLKKFAGASSILV